MIKKIKRDYKNTKKFKKKLFQSLKINHLINTFNNEYLIIKCAIEQGN